MTISIDAYNFQPAEHDSDVREKLRKTLTDHSLPVSRRIRALFGLKHIKDVEGVVMGFEGSSTLFKHEVAYILGQMQETSAIPHLAKILQNLNELPIVRHEAAEALGAIGHRDALPLLEPFLTDSSSVVRETVELAIDKIKHESQNGRYVDPVYKSIDPAPPMEETVSIPDLEKILLDSKQSLFKRYRAMFSLRNINNNEAVLALAKGLQDDSALFRHEIAYVFGQLQNPAAVPALRQALENEEEEALVRHECAEALGSIASPECLELLEKYKEDDKDLVQDSCNVGLDMYHHEVSGAFQYADAM